MEENVVNDSLDLLRPVAHTICETARECLSQIEELTDAELYRTIPEEPEVEKFTVTVAVAEGQEEWGSVSGGGEFEKDATAVIIANPTEGHEFVKWNDDNTEASREVTVTEDVTYTATFKVTEQS